MTAYTATCRTDGCGNAGIVIPMEYDDETETGPPGAVQCGVCGQQITELSGLAR